MLINRKPRRRQSATAYTTASPENLESRQLLTAGLIQVDPAMAPSSGSFERIVNGEQTSEFQSVGIVNDGCTGTLISPTHVLTAAHCVENGRGGYIGDTDGTFRVNGQLYRTVKVTAHPQYNPNNFSAGYDIAIMELDRPVTGVEPSQILRQAPVVGDLLTLVGFGESGSSQSGSNNDFGNKHVGVTPLEEITQNHLSWTLDNHNEANTAPGDSGGPAFVEINGQLLIAGVTSGGAGNAHSLGGDSFDTRVDTLATWIDSVVDSETPDPDPNPDPDPDPPADDHANTPGTDATRIVLNDDGVGTATGNLEEAGDRDVFRVDVAEASSVSIQLTGIDDVDTYLRVYDEAGNLIGENDDSGGTLNSFLTIDLDSGTHYISAGSYADSETGNYSVSVRATPVDDPGDPDPAPTDVLLADSGGNYEVLRDGADLVLRTVGGSELFRQNASLITTLRIQGSSNVDRVTVLNTGSAVDTPIAFNGAGANDNFNGRLATGQLSLNGGGGNDTLSGGMADDVITGGSGADRVFAGAGNDLVDGGDGNDRLFGNAGRDTISGSTGDDRIRGGAGNDLLEGGGGVDMLHGDRGNDTINGGDGNDRIYGGNGRDLIDGGAGNDRLFGNNGYDTISGGSGNDFIRGGRGRDLLSGDAGNDRLLGDQHNDTLIGGSGSDRATGGAGADVIDVQESPLPDGVDSVFGAGLTDTVFMDPDDLLI